MRRTLDIFIIVILINTCFLIKQATAQSTSWTGTTSTAWATSTNWTNGVPSAALNVVIGDANFTGSYQPSITATATALSLTIGSGSIISTLTMTATLTVSGNVTIGSNGTLAENTTSTTYYLSLTGNFSNSGVYSTVNTNALVKMAGTTQSIGGTTTTSFQQLTISSGTTTLNQNITVTTLFTVTGTFDPNNPTYTVNLTGASFTLSSGGDLRVQASTFAGNYNINPTSVNAASTIEYASTTQNQTVTNAFTYGILKVSGGMTALLAGNMPALTGNITITAGTLDLSTYTANRSTSGGTLTVANGASLNIGGTGSFPTNYKTITLGASSTVEYYGANQTVLATTYGNLTLSCNSGAGVETMPAAKFTVAGNFVTNVNGGTSLSLTEASIITFSGSVTIGASTTFNESTFSPPIAGNFTNNGTFTSTTGTVTLSGASKTISGTGTTTFYNLTITGAGITASSSTSFTVAGTFTTSGSGTFTHTSGGAGIITLSGTTKTIVGTGIAFSNLTISGSISTAVALTIAGNFVVSNSFTSTAGIITLSGTSASISGAGATFKVFSLTVSGTYTCSSNITVTSILSVTGSFSASAGTVTFAGAAQPITGSPSFYALTINSGSTVTLNANITVTNALTLNGTFIPNTYLVTLTGATIFSLGATAILDVMASTFAGNYNINPTTVTAASTVKYNSTTTNQTVSNSFSYSNLTISGTTTASAAGILTITGNLTVSTGTLDLLTYTANRSTAGGTITVSNGASLNIGGTNPFPSNYSTITLGASSSVQYYGANQAVVAATYGNLTLSSNSGAAVKTMPATAFTIAGSLTSNINGGTSCSFSAGNTITVTGSVTIGASTTFSDLTYNLTVGGSFTNNGTYSNTTAGTATFSGSAAVISGTGSTTFYSLTITGAGITASSSTSFTVGGTLATSGSGTFTHTVGGAGIITLSGTSKTITGTGIVFNNLTISGSISTAVALTIAGNLVVSNSFTSTVSVITLSGTSNSISGGGGTFSMFSLAVSGTYTCSTSFTITSNLTVTGSLTATVGTATFTGTSTLNGTANLYSVTINATSLTLSTNASLGIAGVFTITAGSFNATTNAPTSVTFNGSGVQTVNALTYYNLTMATGGAKTAAGAITVSGNFTINSSVTFSAGSYIHTISGNIANSGTFTAGTGTVQMSGASDASVTGATTFNILTINKSAITNNIAVNSNITVATVNMTSGNIQTGSNTITITTARTGSGYITGTITLTNSFSTGVAYALESPYNTITFTSVSGVTAVTETALLGLVADFPLDNAINREYDFSVPAGSYTANISLDYQTSELNGCVADSMNLWENNTGTWLEKGRTTNNTANNYLTLNALTNIVGRWTMTDSITVVSWTGAVSTAWENPANWSSSAVPTSTSVVELGNNVFANQPVISSAATVGSIIFASTTPVTLTIGAGGSLTTNTALNGNISGIWTGNATHTINIGAQTLTIGGSLTQSDGTSGHVINVIIGTGSVTIAGALNETGSANITFTGNGTLNLSSNYNYTSGTFTPSNGTVIYNGTSSQVVAGLSYYNLTVANTAGTATSSATIHVSNNLTLNASAAYEANDSLVVGGNVTISSGSTFSSGTPYILAGGNWSNSGTFTPASGTVVLNGASAQSVSATTFNNLTVNNSGGTATLTGNIVLNGNLSLSNGTLDLSTYTANQSGAGGTFTISAATTLKIGGTSNFPTGYSATTIPPSSTVVYDGTIAQTVSALTYGNLTFTNGGATAKTLSGATTVSGNLLINSGATFAGGSYALKLQGNWTNNGTFTPSSSTVTLSGSSNTLTGATIFNALTVSGNYTGINNITVNGATTLSGTYSAGTTTVNIAGNFVNTGTLSSSDTITFSGTSAQSLQINSGLASTGIVNFNGTVAPTIISTISPTFAVLNINNTGGVSPVSNWIVNGACTIGSGATFTGGAYNHTFYGTFTNNGTVTSNDTLNFLPSSAVTITLLGTAFTSTGTIVFGGSGALTLSGTPGTVTNVLVSNTSGITLPSSWTIIGDVTITASSTLHAGTALSHTLSGTLNALGVFNGGTSTITMNGSGKNITGTGTISFYNLTIGTGGNITALNNISITDNFTNNATFSSANYSVTFTGTGPSVISGSTTPTPIYNLTVNKTSATTTLSVNISSISYINVLSGTLDLTSSTVTQTTGGTLTVDSAASLLVGGSNNIPTFSTYLLDVNSTVEFYGATQTISATPQYGNLTISATGTETAGGALTLLNNFTLTSGTFTGGNHTHNIGGNWSMTGGTFTNTNTTINFNGAPQTISSTGSFNNVISNNPSGSITLLANTTITGTLTLTNGNIITGTYTLILPSGASVSQTSGYVIGNLEQYISSTASKTFEVGDAAGYAPVQVAFSSVSVAGNLIVTATAGNDADIINSSINPNEDVDRYWTLTNSGITFTNYSATFNFSASDVSAGAVTSSFIVARKTSGTWTFPTVGTKTSTSTQCTGNTVFGDFQVGQYGQKVWSGGASTNNWGDAANWNPTGVPATTDNIVLTGANTINVNVAAVCKDLTLNNSELTLSVLSGESVTSSGNFTLTAGTFNTATSFPSITYLTTITGGLVNYNGSGAQTVVANQYHNLTLSNAGTKTFASGTTWIGDTLTVSGSATANATTNSTEIDYNMSGNQIIAAINYYNLSLDSSGTKTCVAGTIGVAGILSINENTILDASTNSPTVTYNGSGTQNIPAVNYYNLTLGNAGTKTFASGITGINNILTISGSATANATTNSSTIQFQGSGAQTIPTFTYYNLTLSNGGTKSLAGATTITGALTISGYVDFDITSNNYGITLLGNLVNDGSVATTFNARSGTVTFNGTTNINGTSSTTFNNITINTGESLTVSSSNTINGNIQNNGTFTCTSGTMTFNGTTTFSGSSSSSFNTIVNSGTLNLASSTLNIVGNFTNNSTVNSGTSTVTFNGSSNQSITSGGATLYNVTINNSSGVTQVDNLNISNVLTLTSGNITTGSNRVILTSTSSGAVTGFSSSSYVNGDLRRNIASNTATYSFPVGTSSMYTLEAIVNHNLAGVNYIDASFGSKPGNDNGLNLTEKGTYYTSVNSTGVWYLTPDGEPSGGTYDLYCYINAFTGLTNNSFAILSRPTASTTAADWSTAGGTINPYNGLGRKISDGYALRLGLTSFSQKGIGQSGFVLPIQLSTFEVAEQGANAVLNWTTSSEMDNSHFDIDLATSNSSTDYLSFSKIGEVKGQGTSFNTTNYQFTDSNILKSGTRYYRLKQVNEDSTFSYSDIRFLTFNNESLSVSEVYPNPASEGFNFNIITNKDLAANIYLVNSIGQTVREENISIKQGATLIKINIGNLSAGLYYLRIYDPTQGIQVNRKIIKN